MSCQLDELFSGHQVVLASSEPACAQMQQAAFQQMLHTHSLALCTAAAQSNSSAHFCVAEQLVGQHTDNMQQWLYITDLYILPQCYLQLLSQSLSLEGQEGILKV